MGPNTTVGKAGIGGSVGIILVWILSLLGIVVPEAVDGAIVTLSVMIFSWIMPGPKEMDKGSE